jgi:uncharacterized membrane protein
MLACAQNAGFASRALLVDMPHRTVARKHFLMLQTDLKHQQQQERDSAVSSSDSASAVGRCFCSNCGRAPLDCPLAWHVGGSCVLWWRRAMQQQRPHAPPLLAGAADAPGGVLLQHPALQQLTCGADAWLVAQHWKHARKLLRLLWRAALDANLLPSLPRNELQRMLLRVRLPCGVTFASGRVSGCHGCTALNCAGNDLMLAVVGTAGNTGRAATLAAALSMELRCLLADQAVEVTVEATEMPLEDNIETAAMCCPVPMRQTGCTERRQRARKAPLCASLVETTDKGWWQLVGAAGFPPHAVLAVELHKEDSDATAQHLAAALLLGLRQSGCGVFGALSVLGPGGGPEALFVGRYVGCD